MTHAFDKVRTEVETLAIARHEGQRAARGGWLPRACPYKPNSKSGTFSMVLYKCWQSWGEGYNSIA